MPPHTAIIEPIRLTDGEAICRCIELFVRFAADALVEDNLLALRGR